MRAKAIPSPSTCADPLAASARLLLMARGLQDQVSDFSRVGDQREMPCVQLNRMGLHAVCQKTLEVGRYRLIQLKTSLPDRLCLPCRDRGTSGKQRGGNALQHGVQHFRLSVLDAV